MSRSSFNVEVSNAEADGADRPSTEEEDLRCVVRARCVSTDTAFIRVSLELGNISIVIVHMVRIISKLGHYADSGVPNELHSI